MASQLLASQSQVPRKHLHSHKTQDQDYQQHHVKTLLLLVTPALLDVVLHQLLVTRNVLPILPLPRLSHKTNVLLRTLSLTTHSD